MSARKSFDIGRKRPAGKRKAVKAPVVRRARSPRRSSLAERRRQTRNAYLIAIGVVILCVLGAVVYLFWRPEVRIAEVASEDASLAELAKQELEGTYWFLFPRDSIFFYPEKRIRESILAAHPRYSAVSITRSGFDAIKISTVSRTTAFWWCGTPEEGSANDLNCYEADAEGFVFAPVTLDVSASTTPDLLALRLYAELEADPGSEGYPLRARIQSLGSIPDVLRFVKAMKELGVSVVSLAIRADEADVFDESGTRLTYVIGREADAVRLAASVLPSLDIAGGAIEYVDLRFSGKAYLKRRE